MYWPGTRFSERRKRSVGRVADCSARGSSMDSGAPQPTADRRLSVVMPRKSREIPLAWDFGELLLNDVEDFFMTGPLSLG